jgi:hypothetical protein
MHASHREDSTLAGPDKAETDQTIKEMQEPKLDMTVKGNLQDFLGVNGKRTHRSVLCSKRCHPNDGIAKGNEESRFPNSINSSKDAL